MDARRNWSSLAQEMLEEIATRISSLEDFTAFRGVCRSWRAAVSNDKFGKSCRRILPLIMLAESEGRDDREFYGLSRRAVALRLPLPEAKGKLCVDVGFGWLLTVVDSGEVTLLNPFSRAEIQLPNLKTFHLVRRHMEENYGHNQVFLLKRAVLSANPSHTSNFVLMAIYREFHELVFWRPHELRWTKLESTSFWDVNYYNGKFYAIDRYCQIWAIDEFALDHGVVMSMDSEFLFGFRTPYLVESSSTGELLVLLREVSFDNDSFGRVVNFRVIQLDVMNREWREINSLRDDAVFVGHNVAVSVPASSFPYALKSNCIYFTDDSIKAYTLTIQRDLGGIGDMGIYNVGDASIQRFSQISESSFGSSSPCPPLWITPSF